MTKITKESEIMIKKDGDSRQEQKQTYLQMLDDTWERLLIALERYENVLEGRCDFTAVGSRRDLHKDKTQIEESVLEIEFEVMIQIQALRRVVKPITEEIDFFVKDFVHWIAGRDKLPFSDVDHFISPIFYAIQCQKDPKEIRLIWEEIKNKKLPDVVSALTEKEKEKEFLQMWENLEVGKAMTEARLSEFQNEKDRVATTTRHHRGTISKGILRMKTYYTSIDMEKYFNEILNRFFPNFSDNVCLPTPSTNQPKEEPEAGSHSEIPSQELQQLPMSEEQIGVEKDQANIFSNAHKRMSVKRVLKNLFPNWRKMLEIAEAKND